MVCESILKNVFNNNYLIAKKICNKVSELMHSQIINTC